MKDDMETNQTTAEVDGKDYAKPQPSHIVPRNGWILHWFSIGFGLGLARVAPGTWGSLLGIPLGLGLISIREAFGVYPLLTVVLGVVVFSWMCIAFTEKYWLDHDHKAIVVDEVAGLGLGMVFLPSTVIATSLCFIFFRFFDIMKPGPIGRLDRDGVSAFTTLADDLLAGVLAGGVTYLALYLENRYSLYEWLAPDKFLAELWSDYSVF